MFPEAIPRGTLKLSETKLTHKTPAGSVIKCFVVSPNLKVEKKLPRNRLLYAGWFINLPKFQGARPDHVRVETVVQVFISLGI